MTDVVRKDCLAGEKTAFEFDLYSAAFRVKNFTTGCVLACLGEWDELQSVMIGNGIAETIVSNPEFEKGMIRDLTNKVYIQAEKSGCVEVQQII